jgi:ATP-binding cassette, subfamily B, bacterial
MLLPRPVNPGASRIGAITSLRPYARHLKGKWGLILALFLLGLLSAATTLATPLIGKGFIDSVVLKGQFSLLPRLSLALLGLAFCDLLIGGVSRLVHTRLSAGVLVELRQRLFDRALHAPLHDIEPFRHGDLMSRFGSDLPKVESLLVDGVLGFLQQFLFLLVAGGILLTLSVPLALCSFLGVLAALIITACFRGPVERGTALVRDAMVDIAHFLSERLGALRAVRLHRAQEAEIAAFGSFNKALVRRLLGFQVLDTAASGLPSLALSLSLAWIYLAGGGLIEKGVITPGTFVAFILYQGRLVGPAMGLLGLVRNLQESRVSLERVAEFLGDETPAADSPSCAAGSTNDRSIEVREVSFAYPGGRRVLDQATLRIGEGERVALFGASGAGKSTLVQILFGLRAPDSGTCVVPAGGNGTGATLGYAGCDPFLLHATVEENLRYGNGSVSSDDVRLAATLAQADEFISRLPQGYGTAIGGRGLALSDGQRQRIGLARLILRNPRFLVLDEALSALDLETEARVRLNLWRQFPERGFLVITHRLQRLDEYDRLYLLRDGKLFEVTPDELLAELGGEMVRHEPKVIRFPGVATG